MNYIILCKKLRIRQIICLNYIENYSLGLQTTHLSVLVLALRRAKYRKLVKFPKPYMH